MRAPRTSRHLFLAGLLSFALLGFLLLPAHAAGGRLIFTKVFEGSYPEYIYIAVEEDGRAVYRGGSADEPDPPENVQLSPEFTRQLFSLAGQLNYFQGLALEANKAVARMGQKTFAYESGGQRNQVTYNYTTNKTAEELRELFEQYARSRILLNQLQHELVFDRLGLVETLRSLERQFNAGQLAEVPQFVPMLEKIAADKGLMQLAQDRAASLLRRIRGAPATLQLEYGDQDANRYYKMVFVEGGAVTFEARRFDEPPQPHVVDVPQVAVERVWQAVQVAGHFRALEDYQELAGRLSGYRLIYEHGAEHQEVFFAGPPTAAVGEIVHVFQQTVNQGAYRAKLQKAVEENSIMLQVVLQELEKAIARDDLLAPEEFAPLLEGIADTTTQHEIVRAQAQRLLARIRQTEQ